MRAAVLFLLLGPFGLGGIPARADTQPSTGPIQAPIAGAKADRLILAGIIPAQKPPNASDQPSPDRPAKEQSSDSQRDDEQDEQLEGLIKEFMSTGKEIQGWPGDEPVPMRRTEGGKPALYQVLKATRNENPMLSKRCRRQAMDFSVNKLRRKLGLKDDTAALRAAAKHIQDHIDKIGKMGGKISYSQYLQRIADCQEFCAPLVANLVQCHVLSVARLEHGIVLFDFNSHQLNPTYLSSENGLLKAVAARLHADPDRKVFLIGRASKIGNLRYNRRLSGLRAFAIRDALIEEGVPSQRIETTWFGWEPPQVDNFIAHEYGVQRLFNQVGTQKMNQSVVVVLYSGSGATNRRMQPSQRTGRGPVENQDKGANARPGG